MFSSAFGKILILVLVNNFFYSNSNVKSIEKLFFQLLARSWFWRLFFCLFKLKEILKIDFFSFWQDLGFGECYFFYWNSNWKSIEKLIFFSFWQNLGFNECFFSIQILKKIEIFCFFWGFGKILVLANAFSIQILIENSIENWFFQLLARSWFWRMFCFYSNSN